ncbi:MAG TPA: YciI family protein [Candidatus Eisenbacteria bacterium]|nr:YciI family protein [Candidatus Eisenbacteria bacterium]
MAQYGLILYGDPTRWKKISPEEMQKVTDKYMEWGRKAASAGFLRSSHRLAEDVGKVMRGAGVTDGPFSETKEILGGFYLIEAASYQDAVKLTTGHPHIEYGGTIEVRQLHAVQG